MIFAPMDQNMFCVHLDAFLVRIYKYFHINRHRVTGRLEWPGALWKFLNVFTTASKRKGTCPMEVKQSLAWYVKILDT